jgi:hypothetical protein
MVVLFALYEKGCRQEFESDLAEDNSPLIGCPRHIDL